MLKSYVNTTAPWALTSAAIGENAYGMSETSPASFMAAPEATSHRGAQTAGTVFPHVEARMAEPGTGRTLAIEGLPFQHVGSSVTPAAGR